MASSLNIDEMNRMRESMGLAPLPVPGDASTVPADVSNYEAYQEEEKRKVEREQRNEKIKKAREKAKRFEKLEGKGLAEDDGPEEDSKTWLLGQKHRQKKLDKKRERQRKLEEQQKQREEQMTHTSKDLAGVKVGHEMDEFDLEGGEQILTLKDATIDENEEEGDELENIQLREEASLKDRLNLKKQKLTYDPNAADENSGVLHQYDEVIDGKKRKRFTLDVQGMALDEPDAKRSAMDSMARNQISLDIMKDTPVSDYQEPREASFKKPKKPKKKSTRTKRLEIDEDVRATPSADSKDDDDVMNLDTTQQSTAPQSSAVVIDDDDLQSALTRQRREALKKRKKTTAAELAQKLRAEADESDAVIKDGDDDDDDSREPGLILNETSEFVETLKPADIEEERLKAAARSNKQVKHLSTHRNEEDVEMHDHMDNEDHSDTHETEEKKITETGLEEDTNLNTGIGSTLDLLRRRGLVEKADSDELATRMRNKQKFLADKRRHEELSDLKARQQRERDRASGRMDRMSLKEREEHARWENKHRDQHDSRQLSDIFNREYVPSFELAYVDEHGRHVGQKEAFKNLSHQFHGKGSGKQKTEKKLKKIEEEKKQAAQSVLGSGQETGLNSALGSTTKRTKQAGVRLA